MLYAMRYLEMERRLKLLAAQGVRNIDQYNRKVRQMQHDAPDACSRMRQACRKSSSRFPMSSS
jgi:DNA segregation ATPase FtsK/SpoIIIE-like protein